jgi:hypothetical protein
MRAKPKNKKERRTRGPTKIRKTEITRTARALAAAGLTVRGIEVDAVNGKFSVLTGPSTQDSELDDWLMRKKDARPA